MQSVLVCVNLTFTHECFLFLRFLFLNTGKIRVFVKTLQSGELTSTGSILAQTARVFPPRCTIVLSVKTVPVHILVTMGEAKTFTQLSESFK